MPDSSEPQKALRMSLLKSRLFFPAMIIVMCVLSVAVFRVLPVADFLNAMELKTYDVRMSFSQHQPSPDIVILAFDEATFKINQQEYGRWPYPRKVFADIWDLLDYAKTKLVVCDFMFLSRQKGQEDSDNAMISDFKRHNNVLIGMNFDNDLESNRQIGMGITADDIAHLHPYAINLSPKLDTRSFNLDLDSTGFFNNLYMTFNDFRKIMDPLFDYGQRVGFINMSPDTDGVVRGNPMFFRFQYSVPLKTTRLPVHPAPSGKGFLDAANNPVDANGFLTDEDGEYLSAPKNEYYPYMGFLALLKARFPNGNPPMSLLPDGTLRLPGQDIPLYKNGNFLINWYNVSLERNGWQQSLDSLQAQKRQLDANAQISPTLKKLRSDRLDAHIQEFQKALAGSFSASPYRIVPAWQLMRMVDRFRSNQLTAEDHQLLDSLKNKIIFIGNTTVGGYDIKITPVGEVPGTMILATAFDNLYQNKDYIRHVPVHLQLLVIATLCLLLGLASVRVRNTAVEIGMSLGVIAAYVIAAFALFEMMHLWLNIVVPVIIIFITAAVIFVTKYIQRTKAYQDAYAAANTDSMTGLYNHRFFKTHMVNCMNNADRFNTKFSLILIDIDHFKKFNDTHGHQAGDEVLRCVARKLRDTVRAADTVCRYGGEEMAIILEKSQEEEALRVAEKVVKAVAGEEYPIAEGVTKPVTISAGVATYPTHGKSLEALVEFSDQGLYRAKESGRNRVGAQHDEAKKD